jgi:hypothetical protein
MRLTLTTYDSIVCTSLGCFSDSNAISFANGLIEKVHQFAQLTGMPPEKIRWNEVQVSDWCKYNVFLYVDVPNDWMPIEGTLVLDDKKDTYYPNLAKAHSDYIRGHGIFTRTDECPPKNPHNLFFAK